MWLLRCHHSYGRVFEHGTQSTIRSVTRKHVFLCFQINNAIAPRPREADHNHNLQTANKTQMETIRSSDGATRRLSLAEVVVDKIVIISETTQPSELVRPLVIVVVVLLLLVAGASPLPYSDHCKL
eukprot:SAG31_NODE_4336_length_3343_cov_11.270962_3_plen_126_part_00